MTNGAFVLKSELLGEPDLTACSPLFCRFALRQRVLVVVLACILAVGGIYAFRTIAIDAFPGCHYGPGSGRHESARAVSG